MKRLIPLWYVLCVACVPALAGPTEALALALADARALPPDRCQKTRYLDLTHLSPDKRAEYAKVLSFHLNSLSGESDVVIPRTIAGGVLAFDLRDYGIDGTVYGRLGQTAQEPYFHVLLEYGKERKSAAAPWLPPAVIGELIQLTGSQVPVCRGDWFLYQTAVAKDRAAGYYDMSGQGVDEADFQKLSGANPAEARRLRLETAASVAVSSVALHNRGINRLQALTGGYWTTLDFKASNDRQNTVRLLQGDTEPPHGDANELYAPRPNGLFAYRLQDGKGKRQDTAPDDIASDGRSRSPDRRVHSMLSCVRCHVEGLRPIDDFARRAFKSPLELRSPDYEKLKRLRQLYLSDLPKQLFDDNQKFAAAVWKCNQLTVAENARLYGEAWSYYADEPVDAARAAAECGIPAEAFLPRLRAYLKANPLSDPVIAGYAADPPAPPRREHFEEAYAVLLKMVGVLP